MVRCVCAALSFAVALVTYAWSAPQSPSSWDTAEFQTVPWILGIAHPTGFPLFTLAGFVFTHALWFGTVAWRMNVFSGLCIAVAAGGVTLLASALGAGPIEAVFGTLTFTWCSAVWVKGSHADPHAMSLMFIVFVLLFAVRYGRNGSPRDLVAACACGGLGLAVHPEVLYSLPAIAVALATRRLPGRAALLWGPAALVVPLAFYLYLPLRSAYVAAHGLDPLAQPPFDGSVASEWDSNHPRTLAGFLSEVSGSQFGASSRALAAFDVRTYPAAAVYWWQHAQPELPLLAFFLAALGALALALRDPRSLAILAAGTLGTLPFVNAFKDVEGDVDRYFLPSFATIAVLAALSSRLEIARFAPRARSIVATALLALAAVQQWNANASGTLAYRFDSGGQPTIDAVVRFVPDGAIVVAGWVDATSLEYGAFVEHALGSRVVVPGWPGQYADRYAAWTAVRPVYVFADPNTYANLTSGVPAAWIVDEPGSDDYRHVVRLLPPPGRSSR
jgi:hypothetical protein